MARVITKTVGRPRASTDLQQLRGNPHGGILPKTEEPKPIEPITSAPAWMTDAQKLRWDYLKGQMPPGLLRDVDASVLTQFIVAETNFVAAAIKQQKSKASIISQEGIQLRKAVHAEGDAMARAAAQLGFTPSSRASLGTAVMKAKNAFEKFKTGPHPGQSKPAVITSK